MSTKPLLVSVVRDETMYRRCIAENPNCADCERLMLDNRARNETIPVLYNRVLDGLDPSASRWIVFAHEDFEPLESLSTMVAKADEGRLYGVIGGRLVVESRGQLGGLPRFRYFGQISQSGKDCGAERTIGTPASMDTEVETVDCLFLAVHSSLVRRFRLRFDERLSFDWYVEDFCVAAFLRHRVTTAILPLACCHHSNGNIQPRFFEQMVYLDAKYPEEEFFGACGYTVGGGRTFLRRAQKRFWAFLVRFAPWAVRLRCWSFRPTFLRCLFCK